MVIALILLALVLIYSPSLAVRWVFRYYARPVAGMPGTGAELARYLLDARGLTEVSVECVDDGQDHYSPDEGAVRLGKTNFDGRSLTAVAVAAHEVGHAVQHADGHRLMALRNWLAPKVQVAERLAILGFGIAPVLGAVIRSPVLTALMLLCAVVLFLGRVSMHVLTLPLEWDASFGKALPVIVRGQFVAPEEVPAVRRVLRAAALTYVAAALADLLSVWRWFALLRGRGL
jgi:uncharacterized protein